MSGYDPKTGIFELTMTKAQYWLRRTDVRHLWQPGMTHEQHVRAVLEWQGIEIVKDGGSYFHVRAEPGKVWEALSGRPSNPERSKHYYKK